MFYQFDVDKWAIHLLPPALRKTGIYAFLKVMLYPIKQLSATFMAYRSMVDRQLTYNAFTNYLERFLNGLFFFDDGVIFITEKQSERVYLSFENEQADAVYMSYQNETPASPMWLSLADPDTVSGSFIVNVPSILTEADKAAVYNWVNYYKMAGTEFSIEVYE